MNVQVLLDVRFLFCNNPLPVLRPAAMEVSDMVNQQDEWVRRLSGPNREDAISELRAFLVRGLTKSMASRGGGDAFAQDIAQDAVIRILDSLDQFAGRSKFTTWAMTIATRLAISELRRRRHQDVSLDSLANGGALQIEDTTDDGNADAAKRDALSTLRQLVDETLTDKQKIAMQAMLNGLAIEEIASRLGSNRNAVYKLIHDARKKLRTGLEKAGITAETLADLFA